MKRWLGSHHELDSGLIALVSHRGHGVIPASVRKRRTDLTAPLSVSLRGGALGPNHTNLGTDLNNLAEPLRTTKQL